MWEYIQMKSQNLFSEFADNTFSQYLQFHFLSSNFRPKYGFISYQTLSTLWHFVTWQVTNWNVIRGYLCEDFYFIFRCYSYDYGDTGLHVCRLSHQTTSTLYLIDEPYIRSEAAVTYQRGACYNVTIECQVYISMEW